jgi:GrpB-like predicted nucleotidyltransferase (UPF0157 family)
MVEELREHLYGVTYARRLKPLKIEEVDSFLDSLAKEFGVPKPNYCVYKVVQVRALEPWKTEHGGSFRIRGMRASDIIDFGAVFRTVGKLGYIVLMFESTKGISRKAVVHEFFHYLHWLQRGMKDPETREEYDEEERRARRETDRYLRKLRLKLLNVEP